MYVADYRPVPPYVQERPSASSSDLGRQPQQSEHEHEQGCNREPPYFQDAKGYVYVQEIIGGPAQCVGCLGTIHTLCYVYV